MVLHSTFQEEKSLDFGLPHSRKDQLGYKTTFFLYPRNYLDVKSGTLPRRKKQRLTPRLLSHLTKIGCVILTNSLAVITLIWVAGD